MSKQQMGRIFSTLSQTNLTKQARWQVVKAVAEGKIYHISIKTDRIQISVVG